MARKTTIDDTLNRLAHRTHTPRGQHAATDHNYLSLLNRIPVDQRPAAKQMPLGCDIGQKPRKRSAIFTRWSAAACLLLVLGIGLAIAGVWYHQHYYDPSASESPSAEQSGTSQEPRTLVYQQTPLADITAELSAIYHTPILITHPELGNYCVTATFSTAESLDEILAVLAEIGNFNVLQTAEGFVIE